MRFGEVSDVKPVDENLSPPKPTSAVRGGELQRTRVDDSPVDSSVIQFVNKTIGTVHLFIQRSELFGGRTLETICGRWQCGSPDAPGKGG